MARSLQFEPMLLALVLECQHDTAIFRSPVNAEDVRPSIRYRLERAPEAVREQHG